MGPRFEKILTRSSEYTNGAKDNDQPQDDSLAKLEEVLVQALPASVHLLVLCRIKRQNLFPPGIQVEFYRFTDLEDNEDAEWWKQDKEPFVICIERPNFHTRKGLILFPPANPTPEMIQAFDNFVGWTESQCFQCTPPSLWSTMESLCASHNNAKPENNKGIPGIMLSILDVEQAKNINISDTNDAYHCIRPVEDKDVNEMASQWKWRAEHSEEIMRKCIKTMTSCALLVGNELASSALQSPIGAINVLYTSESHRRKGYGKIVMEWISKAAAEQQGIPPLAEVEVWNDASKHLLEKVGYEEVYRTKWFYYDPPSK